MGCLYNFILHGTVVQSGLADITDEYRIICLQAQNKAIREGQQTPSKSTEQVFFSIPIVLC
jgi:hypothetical protein